MVQYKKLIITKLYYTRVKTITIEAGASSIVVNWFFLKISQNQPKYFAVFYFCLQQMLQLIQVILQNDQFLYFYTNVM